MLLKTGGLQEFNPRTKQVEDKFEQELQLMMRNARATGDKNAIDMFQDVIAMDKDSSSSRRRRETAET